MKRILSALMLLMVSAAIVGCEASARVGDEDVDGERTTVKKTTVRESDGDVSTKTEVKRDD
jgi:hypothetical protein